MRPDSADFRPDTADFRPYRADSRLERACGRRTDRWTDKQKSPCVLKDFVPFGAAALYPLTSVHIVNFTIIQSREMGIADHILPLGDLC